MKLLANVGSNLSTMGAKALFKLKKISPELLIGGGVVLLVTSTVMACKATKKAEKYVEEFNNKVEGIKADKEECLISDNEAKTAIMKAKAELVGHIAGTYAISASIGMAGIAMIFTSHGIMKKRNGMLLASYNALDAAFQKYREHVRADGEDGVERDHRYLLGDDYPREADDGLDNDSITDINKKGLQLAHQNNPYGPYCFEFSKYTSNKWEPHVISNLNTIRSLEQWADRKLRFNGHVFLNDALEYVGLDPVPWGQLVGWLRGTEEDGLPKHITVMATEDSQMLEMDTEGWKRPIMLDFNCDGVIWDRI